MHKNLVPDLYMMDWQRKHLPDCQNFFITDFDMVLRDKKDNLMIIEVKRQKASFKRCQEITYSLVSELIKQGIKANPEGLRIPSFNYHLFKVKFHGYHLLQFENTTFEDGLVYWDKQEVSEDTLKKILSFEVSATTPIDNYNKIQYNAI